MKVRWTENSLRLRITPSELTQILGGQAVVVALAMPGGVRWQVNIQPATETSLFSEQSSAILSLAPGDRQRLAEPEAEGIYFHTEDGLRYFVEKDFPCVHPHAAESLEPVTETFDAPNEFERRKMETTDGK